MSLSKLPSPRFSARLSASAALITMGMTGPIAAASACKLSLDRPALAAPITLTTDGNDLLVDVVADPAIGHLIVSVEHPRSATVFTALAPVSSDGIAQSRVVDALLDADQRDIRYRLSISDVGETALMDPFPFSVFLRCPGSAKRYDLLPGVETNGLLVTRALADALAAGPSCDVFNQARVLTSSIDPDLCMAAKTLVHQLNLLDVGQSPGRACRHEWQTIVPFEEEAWSFTQITRPSSSGSATVGQVGGLEHGAAGCFGLQGTALNGEIDGWTFAFPDLAFGTPVQSTNRGVTEVEQSILCIDGGGACPTACPGTVDVTLDYAGCVASHSVACDGDSQAASYAMIDWNFEVDGALVTLEPSPSVSSSAGPSGSTEASIRATADHEYQRSGPHRTPAPTVARLEGEAILGYTVASPNHDGTAYAFAESNSTYHLTLAASGAACTDSETVFATVTTPPLPQNRSDGLKMKRWWPDEDNNLWPRDGWTGPPPPEVCPGVECP